MVFRKNQGQWTENIIFQSPLSFGNIFFETNNFTFILYKHQENHQHLHHEEEEPEYLSGHHFKINFINANPTKVESLGTPSEHYINYFLGNNPDYWASNVHEYSSILYTNLYPGINMKVEGSGSNMKYEYYVAPNTNPDLIRVAYSGVNNLRIEKGNLIYNTSVSDIKELAPYVYQWVEGKKIRVPCYYYLDENTNTVQFKFPKGFNTNYELVIDPTLIFSSYTGSTLNNFGYTATYDTSGNLYGGGITFNPNSGLYGYPAINSFQDTTSGSISGNFNDGFWSDIAISKFSADGSALIYSTLIGGRHNEQPQSMIVNYSNELLIYGRTYSDNYPTSIAAFDTSYNGGADIIVSKLSQDGSSLTASTFLGGSADDGVNHSASPFDYGFTKYNYADDGRGEIIVNDSNEVYVGSATKSNDLFSSGGSFQTNLEGGQDGCIFKLSSDLSTLDWGSYFGGDSMDAVYSVKLDDANNLFFTGGTISSNLPAAGGLNNSFQGGQADGFISKVNPLGSAIIACSYLGTPTYDQSFFVELDENNDVYVFGQTNGIYPITGGKYGQANSTQFIQKLDSNLSLSIWSTTFGTGQTDSVNISPTAFLVDNCGKIYISGWGGLTNNSNGFTDGLDVDANSYQNTTDGSDFYFLVLDKDANTKLYSTFFGGNQKDSNGNMTSSGEHVDGGTSRFDKNGIIYQAVCASCGNDNLQPFPTTTGAWSQTDSSGAGCNLGVIKMEIYIPTTIVAVDASPIATGCAPLTVNFSSNVQNVNVYNWDFGNGDSSSIQNPTYTYLDTGVFDIVLIGSDSTSCNGTDTAFLQVFVSDDTLNANFIDSSVIDCSNLSFSASAFNYPSTQYEWNMGDNNFYFSQNVNHTYSSPGNYTIKLTVTDSTSCELIDSFQTSIYLPPSFDVNLAISDTVGCAPLEVDFLSSYTDYDSIIWNFDNGTVNSDSFEVTETYLNAGVYSVSLIIVDSNTCNISDTVLRTITVLDDSIQANFSLDSLFYDCDSLLLTGSSNNNSASSYYWNFGNGDTSSTQIASSIYSAGNYSGIYIVSDTTMVCYPSDTANFGIELLPELVANFVADTIGCIPLSISFSNFSNLSNSQYLWEFEDDSTSVQFNPTHVYQTPGLFEVSLIATDTNSCNISDTALLNIRALDGMVMAEITLTQTLYKCDSMQVTLSSNYNGGVHQWAMGNGDTIYGQLTNYTYELTGDYSINYLITDSTQTCQPIDTASALINFYDIQADFSASDTVGCIPLEVDFQNLTQNVTDFWWNSGNGFMGTGQILPTIEYSSVDTFQFTLVAVDSFSCNVSDTSIIQIETRDDFVNAGFDAIVLNDCDSLLTIAFDNNSTNAINYYWDYHTGTSQMMEIDTINFQSPGTYTVQLIAENTNLCHSRDTIFEDFILLPNTYADFIVNPSCTGSIIELTNLSNPNASFLWNFGNGTTSGEFEPNYAYPNSGVYDITLNIIDSNACNASQSSLHQIEIFSYPTANFATDSSYYLYPDEVSFNNLSFGYTHFLWDFGDGTQEDQEFNPTHFYESIDTFLPCLIAVNEICLDRFCKKLEVDLLPIIGIPNAFSPNGDGINDVLFAEGIGIDHLIYKIFNRWGEKVFESNDINIGWDGYFNGSSQEMEVYTYIVNVIFIDGSEQVLRGNITLLR